MKTRSIIFSAPMVRAILADMKAAAEFFSLNPSAALLAFDWWTKGRKQAELRQPEHHLEQEPVVLWHRSGDGYAPVTLEQNHPPEPLTLDEALAQGWRRFYAHLPSRKPEQEPVARDDLREDPRDPNDFIDSLRGLDTNARVRFYEHDFYVLSNFSAFTLHWREQRFDTSEAAYHYEKFPHARHLQEAIRCAPSAHAAFKLAERNKAERRPDWDDVKVQIMLDILRAKVRQHDYVRRKLLETGDRELVEDSWRDDFWGWGPNRDGHNMLGKLWMEVRAELRATTASRQDAAVPWLA
jgi:ribA/ribD-fused uncharacterized protein